MATDIILKKKRELSLIGLVPKYRWKQALGYMLLTCRDIGLCLEQVKQIHSIMINQFDQRVPNEAKKEGEEWFHSILEIQKRRALNLLLAQTEESNYQKRLRAENERIIGRG